MRNDCQYIIFTIGDRQFVMRLLDVDRIVCGIPISFLPNANDWFLGTITINGKIIPVLDIGKKVNNKHHYPSPTGRLIIATVSEMPIALAVDEIKCICDRDEIASPDGTLSFRSVGCLENIWELQNGMLFIHDINSLFAVREEQLLSLING